MSVLKNSVGVWAFGPAVTRFVPAGYHPGAAAEPMVDKTKRVAEGLSDLLDGLEYHYPGEVNEENVEEILSVLGEHGMDLPVIAAGLHTDPTYSLGAFVNPDEGLRRRGIDTLRRGIDLCSEIGSSFIIWPGAEGYNYTFQRPYAQVWRGFVEGIAEVTDYANERGVTMLDVAIGALAARPEVSSVIAGATRPEQVRENVAAASVTLSDDVLRAIDDALRTAAVW